MKDKNDIEWVQTDGSTHQYGRIIREGVYEFKEWIGGCEDGKTIDEMAVRDFDDAGCWLQDTVSLVDYNEQEIESHISSYYNSLDQIKEEYGDGENGWMWIVAECIFEQESELY